MKFGLLKYSRSRNFGDQIQSLAAKQYLPIVNNLIDRDYLSEYDKDEKVKLIMNGWFMAEPQNWPPSPFIIPLLISFHITHDYEANKKLFSQEAIAFYKKNEPVGCRDYYTLDLLVKHGINAYYSGCLTLTLGNKYLVKPRTENIYMVDVLYKVGEKKLNWRGRLKRKWLIKQLIPDYILDKANMITQVLPKDTVEAQKFEIAEEALKKYATAKLVITSRIHCALPCIALNTPVLFIDGGLEKATDQTRLKGIIEYMNSYNIDSLENEYRGFLTELFTKTNFNNPLNINWQTPPENPAKHLQVVEMLKEKCQQFIAGI